MHQCRVYLDNDFYCSSDMNTKSLFFALFFYRKTTENLQCAWRDERYFFYQNPVIIVFIFTVAVLVAHSSVSLSYCTLLGCH